MRRRGAAGITCSRLNPEAINDTAVQQFPIGNTVQSHPASHDQVATVRQLNTAGRQFEDNLFSDVLNRQGQIHVRLADVGLLLAFWNAEQTLPLFVVAHAQAYRVIKIIQIQ